MNVQIEKFKNKFLVRCKFDDRILAVIHRTEKRFWNKDKLEWSLPIESLLEFSNDIAQIEGVKIDIKENRPHAILIQNSNNYELKFAQFINQFDHFKSIHNVQHDMKNKKLIIPFEKVTDILDLLNKQKISYSVSKNDQKNNITVDQTINETDCIVENKKENEKKVIKRKASSV